MEYEYNRYRFHANEPLANDPEQPHDPSEVAGLGVIRARRRLIWAILFLVTPAAALVAALLPESAARLLLGGVLLAFAAAILRHAWARCPRCGDRFNHFNPWTRKCVFCGLPLYPRNDSSEHDNSV
jgi:ribosomal protein L37E